MNPPSFHRTGLGLGFGVLISLSSLVGIANADATAYFSGLSTDEKSTYLDWVDAKSSSYSRHAFLVAAADDDESGEDDGAAIFWNVDESDIIHFAIAVRAVGWVGLGISEAGGMLGSDIALFTASNPTVLVDAHVVGDLSMPMTDECQNWNLEDATMASGEDGWMILEMSRSMDTGDAQDRPIMYDVDLWTAPTRIIAAWGDDDAVSYHGEKKGRGSLRIFANYTDEVTEKKALLDTLELGMDGYFDVVEDDYEIPTNETTYQYLCKTFDELNITLPDGQSSVTMIGAIPILDEDTSKFVHHFTVYLVKECAYSLESVFYRSMIYAWAPGDEGMALPSDVGFPLFDTENKQAVFIEIHYHNPSLVSGMIDSSGMRFYYVNDERTNKAGILEIGDPWVMLYDTPIGDGLTQYSFTCPSGCSNTFVAEEGVTILSEALHMHKSGVRMTNEVIRNGEVFHKAVVDVYDFDQQGAFLTPQESYQVLPGDSFRTTCYYKDGVKFGIGSDDEMCIAFILYYPARDLLSMPWICPHGVPDYGSGCVTELEQGDLDSVDELGRSFGASSGECVATTDTVSSTESTESSENTAGSTVSSTVTAAPPVSAESSETTSAPSQVPATDDKAGSGAATASDNTQSDAAGFSVSFVMQAVSVFAVANLV